MTAAVLWSGGKDCFAAGIRSGALADRATRLVTFVPAGRPAAFRCHPLGVMRRQADALGIAHELVPIDADRWEASYRDAFAQLAREGVQRVVTGDITPEVWPWLPAATTAAGLALETPLAQEDGADPAELLDFLAAEGVVATVSGMRADHYRPTFLGRPIGRELLRAHGFEDPAAFHPCGELGEYHTVVTAYGPRSFLPAGVCPATCEHVERDGIWSLEFMSDFH